MYRAYWLAGWRGTASGSDPWLKVFSADGAMTANPMLWSAHRAGPAHKEWIQARLSSEAFRRRCNCKM